MVITLDPWIEDTLASSRPSPPWLLRPLVEELRIWSAKLKGQGLPAVLLVNPQIRLLVRRTLRESLPDLHVLATSEVSADTRIESIEIGRAHV